ncbi:MAG TPA: cupin domain-containing protein [Deltaproteobacteria bacterium]|jgi:mannose-6-phosphate isomerase-like protein (cupin superfamily)|nr:cupin domain-containing protein [Deltaproteobacteria bacterium]
MAGVPSHPCAIAPHEYAVYDDAKMGKATLFASPRMLVGLNCFLPGQEHSLHAHPGLDKLYLVLEGSGVFLLKGRELPMQAGELLIAPEGIPHGIRNTGQGKLLVLAVLAPGPS